MIWKNLSSLFLPSPVFHMQTEPESSESSSRRVYGTVSCSIGTLTSSGASEHSVQCCCRCVCNGNNGAQPSQLLIWTHAALQVWGPALQILLSGLLSNVMATFCSPIRAKIPKGQASSSFLFPLHWLILDLDKKSLNKI